MEVNVLRERTVKGLEAARLEGRVGGRPVGSYNKKKASAVVFIEMLYVILAKPTTTD
jgi:DNA invertase Pin-like site-specific DNA recombinase